MNPDVDRAAGLVATRLGLVGPSLEELQRAAETAQTIDDLPGWALGVLNAIAEENANQPVGSSDGLGEIDYAGMDDGERFLTEVGERMLPTDGMIIVPPPTAA